MHRHSTGYGHTTTPTYSADGLAAAAAAALAPIILRGGDTTAAASAPPSLATPNPAAMGLLSIEEPLESAWVFARWQSDLVLPASLRQSQEEGGMATRNRLHALAAAAAECGVALQGGRGGSRMLALDDLASKARIGLAATAARLLGVGAGDLGDGSSASVPTSLSAHHGPRRQRGHLNHDIATAAATSSASAPHVTALGPGAAAGLEAATFLRARHAPFGAMTRLEFRRAYIRVSVQNGIPLLSLCSSDAPHAELLLVMHLAEVIAVAPLDVGAASPLDFDSTDPRSGTVSTVRVHGDVAVTLLAAGVELEMAFGSCAAREAWRRWIVATVAAYERMLLLRYADEAEEDAALGRGGGGRGHDVTSASRGLAFAGEAIAARLGLSRGDSHHRPSGGKTLMAQLPPRPDATTIRAYTRRFLESAAAAAAGGGSAAGIGRDVPRRIGATLVVQLRRGVTSPGDAFAAEFRAPLVATLSAAEDFSDGIVTVARRAFIEGGAQKYRASLALPSVTISVPRPSGCDVLVTFQDRRWALRADDVVHRDALVRFLHAVKARGVAHLPSDQYLGDAASSGDAVSRGAHDPVRHRGSTPTRRKKGGHRRGSTSSSDTETALDVLRHSRDGQLLLLGDHQQLASSELDAHERLSDAGGDSALHRSGSSGTLRGALAVSEADSTDAAASGAFLVELEAMRVGSDGGGRGAPAPFTPRTTGDADASHWSAWLTADLDGRSFAGLSGGVAYRDLGLGIPSLRPYVDSYVATLIAGRPLDDRLRLMRLMRGDEAVTGAASNAGGGGGEGPPRAFRPLPTGAALFHHPSASGASHSAEGWSGAASQRHPGMTPLQRLRVADGAVTSARKSPQRGAVAAAPFVLSTAQRALSHAERRGKAHAASPVSGGSFAPSTPRGRAATPSSTVEVRSARSGASHYQRAPSPHAGVDDGAAAMLPPPRVLPLTAEVLGAWVPPPEPLPVYPNAGHSNSNTTGRGSMGARAVVSAVSSTAHHRRTASGTPAARVQPTGFAGNTHAAAALLQPGAFSAPRVRL